MTGEDLRQYRLQMGWSQEQAAAEFGYSRRGWQYAEKYGPTQKLVLAVKRRGKK